jgi:hypothetical protein
LLHFVIVVLSVVGLSFATLCSVSHTLKVAMLNVVVTPKKLLSQNGSHHFLGKSYKTFFVLFTLSNNKLEFVTGLKVAFKLAKFAAIRIVYIGEVC